MQFEPHATLLEGPSTCLDVLSIVVDTVAWELRVREETVCTEDRLVALGAEVSCFKEGQCIDPWSTIICGTGSQAWQNLFALHG